MAEGGRAQGEDRGADLGVGDDLDAEDIGETGATVISKGAEDEVLALLVENKNSRQHDGAGMGMKREKGDIRWVKAGSSAKLPEGGYVGMP